MVVFFVQLHFTTRVRYGFLSVQLNYTIRRLNLDIISRKKEHIHPVAHCVLETTQSTRASDAIGQNFCFKAAVVRKGSHFALCFYGDLAMHELSGHKTIGVGFQILGE